jgi:hypothetical protein
VDRTQADRLARQIERATVRSDNWSVIGVRPVGAGSDTSYAVELFHRPSRTFVRISSLEVWERLLREHGL